MTDCVDAVEAKAVFAQLDADGDGTLSSAELSSRLSDFGLGDEEISTLFMQLDTNGDGQIDADEWIAGYGRYQAAAAGNLADAVPLSRTLSRSLEAELLEALVEARARPDLVAQRVKERLGWFKGKSMQRPGRDAPVVTKEGKAAVNDALVFLSKQPKQPGFSSEGVLGLELACADHVADIGGQGVASHAGTDGSTFNERQQRYGMWRGKAGECLWYGKTGSQMSGRDMIDDLIVDDGVKSRGHRLCIYDEHYWCAGVSVGAHEVYSNMACIEFAGGYEPDDAAISARQVAGPPKIEGRHPELDNAAFHKIGACEGCGKEIRGGRVVEIPGLGKFHADCFCCKSCSKSLAGEKNKKLEKKQVYCTPCWTKEFGQKAKKSTKARKGMAGMYSDPVAMATGSKTAKKKTGKKKQATSAPKSMAAAKGAMDGMAGMYGNLE